ncbi:MAG: hypothetical protein JW822_01595 [Spirochaetales bacterium]|nr:hypothetical protein [Spirochaetales bacterium]
MKRIILMVFICVLLQPLFSETIFIYLEESCNGENGIYLTEIKEGIFDALFESGHVVFDNSKDDASHSYIKLKNFSVPLNVAVKGGARYLLAVAVESTVEKIDEAQERISSTAHVYLLQARTSTIIYSGTVTLSNSEVEGVMSKEHLGFELGYLIAHMIDGMWGAEFY